METILTNYPTIKNKPEFDITIHYPCENLKDAYPNGVYIGYLPDMTIYQNGKPQKIELPLYLTRNEHVKFTLYKQTATIADELLCGPREMFLVKCDDSADDLFKEIKDKGRKWGITKKQYQLEATTANRPGDYKYCVDVKIPAIPGYVHRAGKDFRMKFNVRVNSIAKYIMPAPANRPPYWVSEKFEQLPGKLIYVEGEEIDLNFAGDDADDEDKDNV